MRIVGKEKTIISYEEKWEAGMKANDLAKSLGIPSFRRGGVFRGTQKLFDQMDTERLILRQRWLNENAS